MTGSTSNEAGQARVNAGLVPRINRDPNELDPEFRRRLELTLADLYRDHWEFGIQEGYRTPERQNWLWTQGRTRTGPIITQKDGIENLSNHQHRKAADVYPRRNGRFYIPVGDAKEWSVLGEAAERNGLNWGGRWSKLRDLPHVELVD